MKHTVLDGIRTLASTTAGYACLIDPDKNEIDDSVRLAKQCEASGVDIIMVGGSLMIRNRFHETIRALKQHLSIPVVIFPGLFDFVCGDADALFLLCMVTSRNPQVLIGEQVRAAPLIHHHGLEAIGTAYMLIESGGNTSVQFMSDSLPIPRTKDDIAIAHALAGQYLGMQLVYMDGGSGAREPISDSMISAVKSHIEVPLIIGGGVRDPETAAAKVLAGADVVAIGTVHEEKNDQGLIRAFADAIHQAGRQRNNRV